jgi:hypothetical protein
MLNVSPEEIPPEYVKVTYQPDLPKIKELLKVDAQGFISWAFLSENHEYSVTHIPQVGLRTLVFLKDETHIPQVAIDCIKLPFLSVVANQERR